MPTAHTIRRLALALALATPLVLPCASGAGAEAPAGKLERTLRPLGDAVFARPVHLAQLVAGVAMLPLALPIAALFADPRDAVEMCVSGPYEMLVRPLGE